MKLNYKHFPSAKSNQPIVILHGLFGSSKNWLSVGKSLSREREVYALDLRNHGDSPHSATHSLEDMVADLSGFIREKSLEDPIVLGHSMGGLVTMLYALKMETDNLPPIAKIIIQDISPRDYPFDYEKEVASMEIPVSDCKSRSEVDRQMQDYVPDPFIRQFLQMNLERKEEGGYYWKLNVSAIAESRKMFSDVFKDLEPSEIPSLFIVGGKSPYILEGDTKRIENFFPSARIHSIEGGGHYVQYTHMKEFVEVVKEWLEEEG